ncbi:MAG: cation:proton antiporter [Candidatus Micrarchaeia archaeon]
MVLTYLVLLLFSGSAFLGFVLNAIFSKIHIANIIPLMFIGILIGFILNKNMPGEDAILQALTPYVTTLAAAFILFDAGMNINFSKLKSIIFRSTIFVMTVALLFALGSAVIAYFSFGWNFTECLAFGFAISGPSALIIPAITKMLNVKDSIKSILVYESVITDVMELVIPFVLFEALATGALSAKAIVYMIAYSFIASTLFGVATSMFWLYLLKAFSAVSKDYSWILTLTMVIATYSSAQLLGMNGLIAIFVFGIVFSLLGSTEIRYGLHDLSFSSRYFAVPDFVGHIKDYQKEIVFFASAFFFVYIGILFKISSLNAFIIIISLCISLMPVFIRMLLSGTLKKYFSIDLYSQKIERNLVNFNVPRGLSPAIIATLPLLLGIYIPNFLDSIFLIILFTNIIYSIGFVLFYKRKKF